MGGSLEVCISTLPVELLYFDSIANLLAANGTGALVKLDQNYPSAQIRFARACVRVDNTSSLLEFAQVFRVGDLVQNDLL